MKKKILSIALAASLALTGVVSAASVWGTYKGNDIIRITKNSVPIKNNDVPAISYNGRTMLPISMLGELGLNYQWDPKNKTVNVLTSKTQVNTSSKEFVSEAEYIELNKVMQEHRAFIYFMDQNELASLGVTLIETSVTSSDLNRSQQQVDRINIDGLQNWVEILKAMGSKNAGSFGQVTNYLKTAKSYLKSGNASAARSEALSARITLNNIYTVLDNEVKATFTVKNLQ